MSEHTPANTGRADSGSAIARIGEGCFHTDVSMPGGHTIIADEPAYTGGTDHGPAPIDLLCASLAACKAVTLRMQAQRHGWPMTAATVSATHRRIPARRLEKGAKGVVDLIDCEVIIEGDRLNDQQRRRLLKLTDHCWVQHALRHATHITTRLTDSISPPDPRAQ